MFFSKALWNLSKGSRGILCFRCIMDAALQLVSLFRAYLIAQTVSKILNGYPFTTMLHMMLPQLIATVIAECIISYLISIISVQCGMRIKNHLRDELLGKILRLGPVYTGQKRSGELTSALVGKIEAIESYYTTYLPCACSVLVIASVVVVWLCCIDAVVAMVCAMGILIVLCVPNIWYHIMQNRGQSDWQLMVEFTADMLDNLQGMTTLKAYGASGARAKKLETLAWAMHERTVKNLSVSEIESLILLLGHGFGSTLSIGIAIWRSSCGIFPAEQLVFTLFLVSACFTPILNLIDAWHMGYHGLTASPAVFELLTASDESYAVISENNHAPCWKGDVSFESVDFAYESNKPVLKNFSLRIPYGKTVALVGRSGSGKSTIIHMMAGFYAAQRGNVLIDSNSIEWYSPSALRAKLGVVWQEPYLFYGTVEDNIRMGMPTATSSQIRRAAQRAQIHDFIEALPQGYKTMVGERGMRLSGGERQRIAIARCFLRDADFIIFDEATSNLDGENEAMIQRSMDELLKGRTALIVAHRLSTVKNADLIYVIDQGRIVQMGTHTELSIQKGVYQELMRKQMGGAPYVR